MRLDPACRDVAASHLCRLAATSEGSPSSQERFRSLAEELRKAVEDERDSSDSKSSFASLSVKCARELFPPSKELGDGWDELLDLAVR